MSAAEGQTGEMLETGPAEPDVNGMLEPEEVGNLEENRTLTDVYEEDLGYEGEVETQAIFNEIAAGRDAEAYDAFLGFNTFAKMTGYDEQIDEFLITGGLSTEDPLRWGKRYKEYLKKWKQDPESNQIPDESVLEDVAEVAGFEDLQNVKEAERENLEGRLNTPGDHRKYVRKRMNELLDGMESSDIKYFYGEEEEFNKKEEAENQLNKMANKLEQRKKSLEDQKEEKKERKEEVQSRLAFFEIFEPAYKSLASIGQRIQGLYNSNGGMISKEELQSRADEYIEEEIVELEELDNEYAPDFKEKIEEIFDFEDGWNEFKKEYDEVREDWKETVEMKHQLLDDLEADIEGIESRMNTLARNEETDIVNFGSRQDMSRIDAFLVDYVAERKIADDVEQKVPEEFRDSLEKFDDVRAKIERAPDEEYEDDEGEIPGYKLMGDTLVISGTNLGNSPSKYGLIRGLKDAQRRYNMDKYLPEGKMVPDNVLIAHDTGGVQYTEINPKQVYKDVDGIPEEELDNDIAAMVAPIFQSADEMMDLFDKGKGYTEDKRIKKDNDGDMPATGAIIQHHLEDGSKVPLFLPEKDLTWLGKRTRELLETPRGSEEYDSLIESMDERFKLEPGAIVTAADYHLGAPDDAIDRTKREKIWRKQRYEEAIYGDAEIPVSLQQSEWYDGDQAWFGEENLNHGFHVNEVIEVFKDELEKTELSELSEDLKQFEEAEELSSEEELEYYKLRSEYYEEESKFLKGFVSELITNLERIPTPHIHRQADGSLPFLRQYIEDLDPSSIISVDGNHIDARQGSEESWMIDWILKGMEYSGEIIRFPSEGASSGYGGKLDVKGERENEAAVKIRDQGDVFPELEEGTGKLFGFHHETRHTKHFLSNIKKDFTTNYPYDEIIYDHIHRWGWVITGDGRSIMVTPSPKNTDHRGETSAYGHSTWGTNIKLTNAAEESDPASNFDWHATHFAGPQTLVDETEFEDNRVFEEMNEMEEQIPETVEFDPEQISPPEPEDGETTQTPEVPAGADIYVNIDGTELTSDLSEDSVQDVINLLEGKKAQIAG